MQFVIDCSKTEEMCDKAVNKFSLAFIYISARHKTQEMCDRVNSQNPFMLGYCPNRYKTQGMCDETADDCLAALKFIPDLFVTSKMLEKLDNPLHVNDDTLFYNDGLYKVTFFANQIHILAVENL